MPIVRPGRVPGQLQDRARRLASPRPSGRLGAVLGACASSRRSSAPTPRSAPATPAPCGTPASTSSSGRAQRRARAASCEIQRDVRERLAGIPGIIPSVDEPGRPRQPQKPLEVEHARRGPGAAQGLRRRSSRTQLYRRARASSTWRCRWSRTSRSTGCWWTASAPPTRRAHRRHRAHRRRAGRRPGGHHLRGRGRRRGRRPRAPARRELRQDAGQVGDLRLSVAAAATGPALVPLAERGQLRAQRDPVRDQSAATWSREVVVSANLDGLPLGTAVAKVSRGRGRR